jgi:plastocyanin
MKQKYSGAFAALAVVFLMAACTPAEQPPADTDVVDISGGQPLPAGDTAARTVHVVLNEWGVAPSETTIAPGRVMFHVMNEGQHQHGLEIQRDGQDWQTGNIPAGGTGTVTLDLQPGTYTCTARSWTRRAITGSGGCRRR